ncbi:MAG: two-component sensor histidine kinase [Eubacterium sp.]|nr:two-component sensor histidine kinase [Eubacterium sp.]
MISAFARKSVDRRTTEVEKQCQILANQIAGRGLQEYSMNTSDTSESTGLSDVEQLANDMGGRIMIIDSHLKILTDTYGNRNGQYLADADVINSLSGKNVEAKKIGKDYLQVLIPIRNSSSGRSGVILAAASLNERNTLTGYLKDQRENLSGIFLLVSLIFSVGIFIFLARNFRGIQGELNNIVSGHQETDLTVRGLKEFQKLSLAINQMIGRYKELESSRQEFVSNVSHELKTPITSMKILADSLLMQEEAPAELYQEFMHDIVGELDRENQIITDLLTLVKMDKKDSSLNISTVNINELLEVLLKRISPIAAQRNITIRLETMRDVVAEVDETKLALACNNIIVNAVKYNNDNGSVDVSLNADHKFFYIRVKDTGCGIPEECQEQIFERFYRVDKDRSRETGGTGLGLAITRKVLLMHKGSIRVHSKEGEGSTFTIRVPLNYVAPPGSRSEGDVGADMYETVR